MPQRGFTVSFDDAGSAPSLIAATDSQDDVYEAPAVAVVARLAPAEGVVGAVSSGSVSGWTASPRCVTATSASVNRVKDGLMSVSPALPSHPRSGSNSR